MIYITTLIFELCISVIIDHCKPVGFLSIRKVDK